jgi:hypothetical protein
VTVLSDITAERLAELIIAEWSDSQSDSGNLWLNSFEALQAAKKDCGEQILQEAYEIAYGRYQGLRSDAEA